MLATYETRIAAAAAAQDPKQLRQEFSRVLHQQAGADGRRRHRLAFREVLYFKLKGSLEAEGLQLSPDDRRALYAVLTVKHHAEGGWARKGRRLKRAGEVPVTLDLTKIVRSTQQALRIARRGASLLDQNDAVCSGEPVFKGTRVPLAQLVEQFRAGVAFADIAEDYPQLDDKALRYAQLSARMGQAPGRPAKPLTVRRTAIEAAD
ncbi:MAG: DUF433 domain-containing protein [Gammaproteobacteria bacterium]|jgi:uncharacterized protein (DUF433 family)|nr:DUF433 domain-containing protein [Gammaproteobacteria bacterium]